MMGFWKIPTSRNGLIFKFAFNFVFSFIFIFAFAFVFVIPSHDGCEEESDKGGEAPDKGHVALAHLSIIIMVSWMVIVLIPIFHG